VNVPRKWVLYAQYKCILVSFFLWSFFSRPVVSPRNRASVSGRRPGGFYVLASAMRVKKIWKRVEFSPVNSERCAYTFRRFNERSKRWLRAKAARSVLPHNAVR